MPTVPPLNTTIKRLDTVESFFASTKASIQHGGNRAFYSPDRDIVQMPEVQSFPRWRKLLRDPCP